MTLSLGFGIVFGTALTLFLIPCFYLILEDMKAVWKGRQRPVVAAS